MTYFQIINKALQYYINEPLEKETFISWGILLEEEEILPLRETAKKEQMYLFLNELKKHTSLLPLYNRLYYQLKRDLESVCIDKEKTIKKAHKHIKKELEKDSFYMDAKCVLEDNDIKDNYSKTALEKLKKYTIQKEEQKIKEYIATGSTEKKIIFTAMENMIYDVVTILPELFFTKKGYSYLPSHYQIEDDNIRNYCYEYVKYNISNFCWENQCLHKEQALIYTMKLIQLVTTLANQKEITFLNNLIEIDEILEEKSETFTSLLSIIYKIKEEISLEENIDEDISSYNTLLFLLNTNSLHEKLSKEEIANILLNNFNNQENNEEQIKTFFDKLIKKREKGNKQKKKNLLIE